MTASPPCKCVPFLPGESPLLLRLGWTSCLAWLIGHRRSDVLGFPGLGHKNPDTRKSFAWCFTCYWDAPSWNAAPRLWESQTMCRGPVFHTTWQPHISSSSWPTPTSSHASHMSWTSDQSNWVMACCWQLWGFFFPLSENTLKNLFILKSAFLRISSVHRVMLPWKRQSNVQPTKIAHGLLEWIAYCHQESKKGLNPSPKWALFQNCLTLTPSLPFAPSA